MESNSFHRAAWLELGVPPEESSQQIEFGAYVNSEAFRTQGLEFEAEYKINSHLFARGGYTYTDAVVQHSFSSDQGAGESINPNFPNIPIGAFSPLVGARPFRVAPHSGYFGLNYTRSKFYSSLTGTLVGRRDDSDFLSPMPISDRPCCCQTAIWTGRISGSILAGGIRSLRG